MKTAIRIATIVLVLCSVAGAAEDGPGPAWREGQVAMAAVQLQAVLSDTDIYNLKQAGIGIPYSRLQSDNTATWLYRSPICKPLNIYKTNGTDAWVTDDLLKFHLEGDWAAVLFGDRTECQTAAAQFLRNRSVRMELGAAVFGARKIRITVLTAPHQSSEAQ